MKNYEMKIEIELDIDHLHDIVNNNLLDDERGRERDFNDDTCGISFPEFLLLKQVREKVDIAECAKIVADFNAEDDRINKEKIYRKINDLNTI